MNAEPDQYRSRLHKFSCKPPGHDTARHRENQRRHRARVKGRVAELEASLFCTQASLDDAIRQIQSLNAEVERLQNALGSRSAASVQTTAQDQLFLELAAYRQHGALDSAASDRATEKTLAALPGISTTTHSEEGVINLELTQSAISEPESSRTQNRTKMPASSLFASGFEDPNDDYAFLPPPSFGESTIPCREAYSIIKDRTSPDLDLSAAKEWLKLGFRRAIAHGDGCRVQTHILFAFIDHITPV